MRRVQVKTNKTARMISQVRLMAVGYLAKAAVAPPDTDWALPIPAEDWAHASARGILVLLDETQIGIELAGMGTEGRRVLAARMAAIIRTGHELTTD